MARALVYGCVRDKDCELPCFRIRAGIGAGWLPSLVTAFTGVEAGSWLHEFGNPGNRRGDAPGFIGCQVAGVVSPFHSVQVIRVVDRRKRHAVGVTDAIAILARFFDAPWGGKTAVLAA
jgi:hypothetical protein